MTALFRTSKVHSANGTRIGCGIIKKVGDEGVLSSVTNELAASGVTSQVSVHTLDDGLVCYFGLATSLEPDLVSYRNPDEFLNGMDCNFTNGCGVHIHNGTSCTNSTTQGGHYTVTTSKLILGYLPCITPLMIVEKHTTQVASKRVSRMIRHSVIDHSLCIPIMGRVFLAVCCRLRQEVVQPHQRHRCPPPQHPPWHLPATLLR